MLTPRGHADHLEALATKCDALLKHYDPNFNLANLDDILASRGITLPLTTPPGISLDQARSPTYVSGDPPSPTAQQKIFSYPTPLVHTGFQLPVGYGHPPPHHPSQPPGAPIPYAMPAAYTPHIHPPLPFGPVPPPRIPPSVPISASGQQQSPRYSNVPGQDPRSNDMSNDEALCKNFGVSEAIVNDFRLENINPDKEDLAVGSSGLTSGRDRHVADVVPRDSANWVCVCVRRNSGSGSLIALGSLPPGDSVHVWLPKDRKNVEHIVDVFFTRLNTHRPIFPRHEFNKSLTDLYDEQAITYDPGFLCSVYLVFALGTLSDLTLPVGGLDHRWRSDCSSTKKLMPLGWPEHDEFFERALTVKPDLRVTLSSLQALILLHWYLYTERQTRTLWRLVGSLVRLGIELGLHHDPTTQEGTFTQEECQLRIQLWATIMVHDRGTSILLGRPLGIAPQDSSTPHPSRSIIDDKFAFSEHFFFSHPVADIQADIVNSLYIPKRQTGDSIMRHANRILGSMADFRRHLPDSYSYYFKGTEDWTSERKAQLVEELTEDQGLTLLKLWITRILLFRAIFNSKELAYPQRVKALTDAIVTSHNVIVIHQQLIKFPDIGFFTSPSPLHIAAMIILYGHMSKNERLSKHLALEDICLALDMLPRFRWPWERRDVGGSYPLIAKLAERVMDVDLQTVQPPSHPFLLPEEIWESEDVSVASPMSSVPAQIKSQQSTPVLTNASYSSTAPGPGYGTVQLAKQSTNNSGTTPPDSQLMEVSSRLFYPFHPEQSLNLSSTTQLGSSHTTSDSVGSQHQQQHQHYRHLLAEAASSHASGNYAYEVPQDMFMSEETVPLYSMPSEINIWNSTSVTNTERCPSTSYLP
jgi:hypothetical protein